MPYFLFLWFCHSRASRIILECNSFVNKAGAPGIHKHSWRFSGFPKIPLSLLPHEKENPCTTQCTTHEDCTIYLIHSLIMHNIAAEKAEKLSIESFYKFLSLFFPSRGVLGNLFSAGSCED